MEYKILTNAQEEKLDKKIQFSFTNAYTPDVYKRQTIGFNYAEPELKELSEALYGTLPMRDNAFAYLTSVQKNAASYKYGTSWNDAGTGRVHLKYDIMAYDGYELYGSEAIDYLKANLVRSPGRKDVVFYDLLPYGVKMCIRDRPLKIKLLLIE